MDCISALRTDNVNIMVLDKTFDKLDICNEVEPWFQTKYSIEGIIHFFFSN